MRITRLHALDLRFPLPAGAGSDALHTDPVYSLATCVLESDSGLLGSGFSLTLGRGNDLVCEAIRLQEAAVLGFEPAELIAELGTRWHRWCNDGQLRWLGPQKGVVHLGLAAAVGALVDLWARSLGKPLWRAMLELSPQQLCDLVDFSTIEDYLARSEALDLVTSRRLHEDVIAGQLERGYPAYDTSVGWLGYPPEALVENVLAARSKGYAAVKVKIGSPALEADVARLGAVRQALGPDYLVMMDANQCWSAAGCGLGMEELPLEMIPHLAEHFAEPCRVRGGRYVRPDAPGSSTALRPESVRRFAHRNEARGDTARALGRVVALLDEQAASSE